MRVFKDYPVTDDELQTLYKAEREKKAEKEEKIKRLEAKEELAREAEKKSLEEERKAKEDEKQNCKQKTQKKLKNKIASKKLPQVEKFGGNDFRVELSEFFRKKQKEDEEVERKNQIQIERNAPEELGAERIVEQAKNKKEELERTQKEKEPPVIEKSKNEEEKHKAWSATINIEKNHVCETPSQEVAKPIFNNKKPEFIEETKKQLEEILPENEKIIKRKLDDMTNSYRFKERASRREMQKLLDNPDTIRKATKFGEKAGKKLELLANKMLKLKDPNVWKEISSFEEKRICFAEYVQIYLEEHILVFKAYTCVGFLTKYTVNGEKIGNNFGLNLKDKECNDDIKQVGIAIYSMIKEKAKNCASKLIKEVAVEVLEFQHDFLSVLGLHSFSSIAKFCKKFTDIIVRQYKNIFARVKNSDLRQLAQIVVEKQIPLFFNVEFLGEDRFLKAVTCPIALQKIQITFDELEDVELEFYVDKSNNTLQKVKASDMFRNLGFSYKQKRARPKNCKVFGYLKITRLQYEKLETNLATKSKYTFGEISIISPKNISCCHFGTDPHEGVQYNNKNEKDLISHQTCTTQKIPQYLASNVSPHQFKRERKIIQVKNRASISKLEVKEDQERNQMKKRENVPDEERLAKEAEEKRLENERLAKEERDRKLKEEERKAKEMEERIQKENERKERVVKIEGERIAKEREKIQKAEAERLAKEESQRSAKEEQVRKQNKEEEIRKKFEESKRKYEERKMQEKERAEKAVSPVPFSKQRPQSLKSPRQSPKSQDRQHIPSSPKISTLNANLQTHNTQNSLKNPSPITEQKSQPSIARSNRPQSCQILKRNSRVSFLRNQFEGLRNEN